MVWALPASRFPARAIHEYALISAVALVPIANCPEYSQWFDITPKVAVFIASVGLACLVMPRQQQGNVPRCSCANILPVGLILTAIASTILSCAPYLSLGGSTWRRLGLPAELSVGIFMMLGTRAMRNNPPFASRILRASCVALLISSLAVIVEFAGAATLFGFSGSPNTARPGGVLGSGAAFGCYASISLFLCVALWVIDDSRPWRHLVMITVIATFGAVLACGTRAAILAVFVGLLVSVAATKRTYTRLLLATYSVLALASLGAATAGYGSFSQRAEQINVDPWGGTRLYVWRDSLELLPSLPVLGYGLEAFPRVYPKVESEQTVLHWPNVSHESTHNYFLDVLISKGFLGLAVALGLSASAFGAFRRFPEATRVPGAMCLAGHMAGLTVCTFFTPQLPTLIYLYLPVCILWGLESGGALRIHRDDRDPASTASAEWNRIARSLSVRSFGVVLIVYATSLAVWDHAVLRAKLLFDSGNLPGAVERFSVARRYAPPGVTAEGWFSREVIINSRSEFSPSIRKMLRRSLDSAIEHDDDFENSYVLLSALMIKEGQNREAAFVLRRALVCFPNWPTAKMLLAAAQAASNGPAAGR